MEEIKKPAENAKKETRRKKEWANKHENDSNKQKTHKTYVYIHLIRTATKQRKTDKEKRTERERWRERAKLDYVMLLLTVVSQHSDDFSAQMTYG